MVDRIMNGIVRHRRIILVIVLVLAAICGAVSFKVPVNSDMTKYLPADSRMKQGIDITAEEFSDLALPSTLRVMFEDLPQEREETVIEELKSIPHVLTASSAGRTEKGGVSYTLFSVSVDCDYRSEEEFAIENDIPEMFQEWKVTVRNDDTNGMEVPFFIIIIAFVILISVLFVLCGSFLEPFLFLFAIGTAIILNMGTNIILGSVSQTTYSISAILQLVLSMDYSLILMNRFRQEKGKSGDNADAMVRALRNAFPSIASSGFTTIVGLLMLVFMRFRIGMDLGLVLAKGVFLSMLCCLALLPSLILLFDKWVVKTQKPALRVPTGALARFSFRFRYVLAAGFAALFIAAWYMDSLAETSYSLSREDPIAEVFPPENPIVMLYANEDEEAAAALAKSLEQKDCVSSVSAWSTTIGREMSADEMADYLGGMLKDGGGAYASMLSGMSDSIDSTALSSFSGMLTPDFIRMLYKLYGLSGDRGTQKMSIYELFEFLSGQTSNPLISAAIGKEGVEAIESFRVVMDAARSSLTGPHHSLMMISTTLPVDGEETQEFIVELLDSAGTKLSGDSYLIGNSVMNQEMRSSFGRELLTISLLTAASIFIVVLVTFRNVLIPFVLVLIVQCGVFLTVATTWLLGYKMYYLALLVVQCILMGATVDYGILFTNYYREKRNIHDIRKALETSYEGAMHSILTSSLFMIFGTGAIGFSPADPAITQICKSISIGASSAALLVIFVLPGILAAIDRFAINTKRAIMLKSG